MLGNEGWNTATTSPELSWKRSSMAFGEEHVPAPEVDCAIFFRACASHGEEHRDLKQTKCHGLLSKLCSGLPMPTRGSNNSRRYNKSIRWTKQFFVPLGLQSSLWPPSEPFVACRLNVSRRSSTAGISSHYDPLSKQSQGFIVLVLEKSALCLMVVTRGRA